jgi:hypothetical protein
VLQISWRRVLAALRLAERDVWQVGRLVREEEYNAVELLPPGPSLNLERVAERLGELESSAYSRQPALPATSDDDQWGDVETRPQRGVDTDDDGIPF